VIGRSRTGADAPRRKRAVGIRAGTALIALTALLVQPLVRPSPASANDLDQFQNARAAYDSQNYALAADLFRGLLVDSPPNDRRPLALESRKYLAAAVLFLGRKQEAEAQFEQLLALEPDYMLDPLAFPDEVGRVFAEVKARVEVDRAKRELEQARAQAQQSQQSAQQGLIRKQQSENLARLIALAGTERVEEQHSRAIAMIPFGVGQFQNDNGGLGLVLAVSEGALLGIAITSFFLHENLRDQDPGTGDLRDQAEVAEAVFRYTNQISLGLFGLLAVTGIIDAQVRFKTGDAHERPRVLPPELTNFDLSFGPGRVSVSGKF
jgi:tetratricopeptide (TPR) repeat protein